MATHFSRAVSSSLSSSGTNQSDLALGTGVTQSYVSQVVNGKTLASARWVSLAADTMRLSAEQKAELHRAAALDHGFEIDLPPPPKR